MAGATVEIVDQLDRTTMLPLAAIAGDGTVDLTVADRVPRSDETVIALVDGRP